MNYFWEKNLGNDFRAASCRLYSLLFWSWSHGVSLFDHCHVITPDRGDSFFVGPCQVIIPFLLGFNKSFEKRCFSFSFVHIRTQQSDCSINDGKKPAFIQFSLKTVFFGNTYKKNVYKKLTVILTTMKKSAFYPIADITWKQKEILMSCYRNWTHFVPQINTWTVSIHYSTADSSEQVLPRVDKCLKMCKENSTLAKEVGDLPKCPALQKKTID